MKGSAIAVAAALEAHLRHRARTGVRWARAGSLPVIEAVDARESAPEADPGESARETLSQIRDEMGDCSRCKLAAGRRNLVFGVGNPDAALMFVGEGPGEDEDRQGEPFVGKAGQLLTRIIEAIGLARDDVYIANVVKSRPPGNRNPEPDEIAACLPFLERQIQAVRPAVLVGLGNIAVKSLLRTTRGIMSLRGNWQEYRGIPFMPTFHPAYLLRTPGDKRLVWEDMLQVAERLNAAAKPGQKPASPKRGPAGADAAPGRDGGNP